MASYVVAAALFIIGSSFLLHFVIQPPGSSTSGLEHLELRSKADDALGILVGSPGVPLGWESTSNGIDAVKRLGLVENGASIRLDADKFDALAKGKLTTSSASNAGVDYAEAKAALGLSGYEFHLRAYPLITPTDSDPYGLSGFNAFRIGYVGDFSGNAPTPTASTEISQIDGLNIDFTYDSTHLTIDDVIPDDSGHIRDELLPLIGANVQQTIISSGSGLEHKFYRVPASTYSALAPGAGLTRALAVSRDGATLGYTKNLELRAIVGKADLTGVTTAQLAWKEWVDTDKGNLSYDCQDYGYAEVSPNGGQTWIALSNTNALRSDDCSNVASGILPQGAAMTTTTVADLTALCAACDNNPSVLFAFHWIADNDNTMGYGWLVDDVTVSVLGDTLMRKTFEEPEYDMLIIGSNIDNHAFEPEDVKEALRDYVDKYGGRVMITGPATNVNWLDRLFDAGIAGSSAGISTPDVTHPLLTLPNALNYQTYPKPTVTWDFTGSDDAALFSAVMAETDKQQILSVSRLGAWGDGQTSEGSVILSSFEPWRFSTAVEARKFFANSITYGKFHYLYIDYGPAVPEGEAVASATRTATMNMFRTGDPSFTEMAFILYVWPGASAAATASAVTVGASPPTNPAATTAASPARVTISWKEPTSNGSAAPVQYRVFRGYSPDSIPSAAEQSIGTVAAPSAAAWVANQVFSFTDSTVSYGTTYYYAVRLETTGGALGTPSAVVSATPTGPPSAPGVPTASGIAGKVRLTWTAPADTGGGNIFGYRVQASTDSGATWTVLGDVGAVTTYDHSVSDDLDRVYKVEAVNAYTSATSSYGPASGTSNAAHRVLPIAAPTLTVTSGAGPGNLTLTWVAPDAAGQTLQGYRILSAADSGGSPGTFTELAYLNNPATLTYTQTDLGASVKRHYQVQGVTEYGDGLLSSSKSATTLGVPSTPTWGTVVRTPVANTRTLAWPAVAASDWPVVRYDVYRTATDGGTLLLIGSSAGTTYIDTPGAGTFYYAIQAVSAAGASATSASITSVGSSIAAPTLSIAQGTGPGNLTLTWTPPALEPGVSVQSYHLLRATSATGAYSDIATPAGASLTYTDTGLGTNATRYYKLQAVTNDGDSAYSDAKNAKTMGAPNTPTWGTAVRTPVTNARTLTWSAVLVSDWPVVRYDVYRAVDDTSTLTLIGSSSGTTYIDSPGAGTFYYALQAVSAVGPSATSTRIASAGSSIAAPTLTATQGVGAQNITLSWSPPSLEAGVVVQSYRLLRATSSGGAFTEIATPSAVATSYTDTLLGTNTTRYYKLQAVTNDGDSAYSAERNAKTMGAPNTPTWGTIVKTAVTNVRTLTWNAPTSDAAIARYDIYWASTSNGDLVKVGESAGSATTFVHSPGAGSQYYAVKAVSYAGTSEMSDRKAST